MQRLLFAMSMLGLASSLVGIHHLQKSLSQPVSKSGKVSGTGYTCSGWACNLPFTCVAAPILSPTTNIWYPNTYTQYFPHMICAPSGWFDTCGQVSIYKCSQVYGSNAAGCTAFTILTGGTFINSSWGCP